MKRVPTGVKGFDKLVQGGFPKNFVVLVSGNPGTGKTIFCLEYLYNGVVKYKEPGIFLTLGQGKEGIMNQAIQFGWNIKKLEKKNLLKIVETEALSLKDVMELIKESVKKIKAKRLVIDSLSTLALYMMRPHWTVAPRTAIAYYSPTLADMKRRMFSFISMN